MRRRVVAGAVLALALALAGPASADAHSIIRTNGPEVSYLSSDATSLNTLTITPNGNDVEFKDPTVDGGIDYGSCRPGQADGNGYVIQAFCAKAGLGKLRVDLGEREDTLKISVALPVQALGGPGADRLDTSDADDVLVGGDGNDTLLPNGGNDKVLAGAGDDDVAGGAGNDDLQLGTGKDKVDGGDGDDVIHARDGESDTIVCGAGTDRVEADTIDSIPDSAGCEQVERTASTASGTSVADRRAPALHLGYDPRQKLSRGRVAVVATTTEAGSLAASGFLSTEGLRLPLKARRVIVKVGGGGGTLVARLSSLQQREAKRARRNGKPVIAELSIVATDAAGNSTRPRTVKIRLA